ncbi:MAG: transposase [Firmicutes bacterium]|nr:transposase [Bacillota bacterium]
MTEGVLDKYKNWKDVGYIPYEYLRKSWQKVLLDIIKNKFGQEPEIKRLIYDLYRRYPKGFYVHARTRMKDARGAARYIGRYLARPAIAEYRIISYDGKKIKFWYVDHTDQKRKEKELDALEFIGKLIMHIPKKHFRMVRRYGLYRRDINKLAQKVVGLYKYIKTRIKSKLKPVVTKKQTWKERLIQNFGKNPLVCPSCKCEMELWAIWHPRYGYIYDAMVDLKEACKENDGQNGREMGRRRNSVSRRSREQSPSQLSLSELWV